MEGFLGPAGQHMLLAREHHQPVLQKQASVAVVECDTKQMQAFHMKSCTFSYANIAQAGCQEQ